MTKKLIKKTSSPISCRPSPQGVEWLEKMFDRPGTGACFCIDTMRTLYQIGTSEIRGKFTREELSLFLDVMNGTWISEGMIGQHLGANVADCEPDGTPDKWGVDLKDCLKKLDGLTLFQCAILETWCKGFWEKNHDGEKALEEWTKILL